MLWDVLCLFFFFLVFPSHFSINSLFIYSFPSPAAFVSRSNSGSQNANHLHSTSQIETKKKKKNYQIPLKKSTSSHLDPFPSTSPISAPHYLSSQLPKILPQQFKRHHHGQGILGRSSQRRQRRPPPPVEIIAVVVAGPVPLSSRR